ncbi:hypothetical protein [Actinomadura hibisca]|uniref:hypothetical protein n=1 Tax=Actinomadura hibisca TaxID=68565 RepID=UPI00083013AD|nr:hypothetical protein [Actinomadura hibisca]
MTVKAAGPLVALLRDIAARRDDPLGVEPALRAGAAPGLLAATDPRLPGALTAKAATRWDAPPHIAAALAWKGYAYWTALPVALGWALNRRVPLFPADATLVRVLDEAPYLVVGLREVSVAVTAADPCAGGPGTVVVPDEAALLALVRDVLLRGHYVPFVRALRTATRAGERGLWGTAAEALASPVAHAVPGAADAVRALLDGLGAPVAGLVELTADPPSVRRRTCCQWVKLSGNTACSTCCLNRDQ